LNFDAEKTVSYWLEGAESDLDVADTLFKGGKYPYCLFFGHLALEKLLKALVVKETKVHAERTHSLPVLAGKTGIKFPKEIEEKLEPFMEFYREGRYPDEQMAFYKKCTKRYAENNLGEIKKVFRWLKKRLSE
jgi:HEPN domain-containing protein